MQTSCSDSLQQVSTTAPPSAYLLWPASPSRNISDIIRDPHWINISQYDTHRADWVPLRIHSSLIDTPS